ncbi:MAG: hypothetical protein V2J10_04665, partial [Wenzhouxiangella sp.]|nr:hypothetical protein [Wenzhouxiangella sp.]
DAESRLDALGLERRDDWREQDRLRHVFSHFELDARVIAAGVTHRGVAEPAGAWHPIDRLAHDPPVGLPAPVQRLIRERMDGR